MRTEHSRPQQSSFGKHGLDEALVSMGDARAALLRLARAFRRPSKTSCEQNLPVVKKRTVRKLDHRIRALTLHIDRQIRAELPAAERPPLPSFNGDRESIPIQRMATLIAAASILADIADLILNELKSCEAGHRQEVLLPLKAFLLHAIRAIDAVERLGPGSCQSAFFSGLQIQLARARNRLSQAKARVADGLDFD